MIDKEISELKAGVKIYDSEIDLFLTFLGVTPSCEYVELTSISSIDGKVRTHFYHMVDLIDCEVCK